MLYRELQRNDLAESVVRTALGHNPGSPELSHVLGLVLVRGRRYTDAVRFLGLAANARPENLRYGYVFAVALHETGDVEGSIEALERVHGHHPGSRDIIEALVIYNRQRGDEDASRRYAEKLEKLEKQRGR